MLSSQYISEIIPQELWDIYSAMEADMIIAFARHVKRLNVASADWMATRLVAMGVLREDLQKIVARYWPDIEKEMLDTFERASYGNLMSDEGIYKAGVAAGALTAAVPINASLTLRRALETGYARALNKLNITNTTAINTTVASLHNVYTQTMMGVLTLNQAVRQATTALSTKGITGAIYPGGRTMELAPYVRMVVKTSVMRTTNEMTFIRAAEYGSDLIQISSHAGARPRCFPFQGRIFSISGTSKKFPALSTTSYGEAAGLFGINCGHYFFPFIEDVDRLPTKEERDPARYLLGKSNAQVYKESQQQRYIERGIREWKHRHEAMQAEGLDFQAQAAKRKIMEWQGRQRALMQDTGRTRRYDRETA